MGKNKGNSKVLKTSQTFPLVNPDKKDSVTNTAMPSYEDVREAREWVDHNKK